MKIFFLLLIVAFQSPVFAQADTIPAPYKRFPVYPPVKLLLPDSVGSFSKADLPKNKPVMLVLFNPGCDHCRKETAELTANIEKFKGVQVVMASWAPLEQIRSFIDEFGLSGHSSITVAQDTHYFLLDYFKPRNIPFHAFYNKKKDLISVFEGTITVEKSLEEIRK